MSWPGRGAATRSKAIASASASAVVSGDRSPV
jgi:hypothetical protein